ncbi:hypothetical protein AB0G15_11705 [Streptosporangium sp. NPDC023825]|uniref:hypothetical protein n=1 Tax=Streptosporangium sp. NPDC023825 TaxID=3154909 RepID=UPI0034285211
MSLIHRSLTALALAGTSLITVAASASPVQAAAVTAVHVSSRTVFITGTSGVDTIKIDILEGKVTVDSTSGVSAGAGCIKSGTNVVQCAGTGSTIQFIDAATLGGKDSVTNNTSLQSSILGGSDNDTLTGGSGRDGLNGGGGDDTLNGNGGIDVANGVSGFDTCTAETESSCEA